MPDEHNSPIETNEAASSAEAAQPSRRPDRPASPATKPLDLPREYGGRKGPEPVRYGDWEKNGRCIDF